MVGLEVARVPLSVPAKCEDVVYTVRVDKSWELSRKTCCKFSAKQQTMLPWCLERCHSFSSSSSTSRHRTWRTQTRPVAKAAAIPVSTVRKITQKKKLVTFVLPAEKKEKNKNILKSHHSAASCFVVLAFVSATFAFKFSPSQVNVLIDDSTLLAPTLFSGKSWEQR